MVSETRTVIIAPYFGEFPWYFKYFIHSCGFNPHFDFLIITDNVWKGVSPPNVKFIHFTLEQVQRLAQTKLETDVIIPYAYKLCDFKPAYGLIFEDYIDGYDYWGQSDIDLILGDLMSFLGGGLIESFDYLSVRHDYTTGCLSFFKNTAFVNGFFKRSKDWRMVFTNPRNFCFDQCNYTMRYLTQGGSIFEIETEIESFTHIVRRSQQANEIRAYFDFIIIEGLPGKLVFDRGKVIYNNRLEGIGYHLFHFKKIHGQRLMPKTIPDKYRISRSKIYV